MQAIWSIIMKNLFCFFPCIDLNMKPWRHLLNEWCNTLSYFRFLTSICILCIYLTIRARTVAFFFSYNCFDDIFTNQSVDVFCLVKIIYQVINYVGIYYDAKAILRAQYGTSWIIHKHKTRYVKSSYILIICCIYWYFWSCGH